MLVLTSEWRARGVRAQDLTHRRCSVLTKPVLERSLKSMLAIAHTRRAAKPPQ